MSTGLGLTAVLLVTVATLSVGAYGWRFSRTTSDFFVASRSVRPALNASAIGGEYLSAASFLGVAGLVLAFGTDMLWYPVGWTAGYLVLLVLTVVTVLLGGLPLLFTAFPALARVHVAGMPLPWVLLAFAVYPFLLALGWFYVRTAERNEADFTDVVERP